MLSSEEAEKRFGYHPPRDNEAVVSHETIREAARRFAIIVGAVVPQSREQSLALTAIEEAMMWANAGIARNQ